MRNIDQHNITEAVIGRLANCDNPRLKALLTSLVTHLHDFVRETRLTEIGRASCRERVCSTV